MSRYIDADKMIYEIRHNLWDWSCVDDIRTSLVLKQTITDIENQPSEDVAPVIHAHWTRKRTLSHDGELYCSKCEWTPEVLGGTTLGDLQLADVYYCPHCGAKMDEAEIVGKRMIDGFIDGMGDNVKSVGQKFINNDKDTVEHTIMGMKNEVTHETG